MSTTPPHMDIYLSMVNDYFSDTVYPLPTAMEPFQLPSPPESPDFYHRYLCIAEPSTYEISQSSRRFQKRLYTPYKRMGHFREHLNRINFSQFVHIPAKCFDLIDQHVNTVCSTDNDKQRFFTHNPYIYTHLKQVLSRFDSSKYIEHIHYLIGFYRHKYTPRSVARSIISYSHYRQLCALFLELEKGLLESDYTPVRNSKRLIPYTAVMQCLLTLLHIHPTYYLPTLIHQTKKWVYYKLIFMTLLNTPLGQATMREFMLKNTSCQACVDPEQSSPCYGLDRDVKVALYHVMSH
jgi:hypothetical protein